ncbi:Heat shock protein DnaJ with tetratricopeptiderepeat [Forsythia ovata]|uniref:Heat shock protein DnaJ with tetratricopeptiderepeat n=1 Tax=Forsythia ovata TaxID=205694 RepID=A0ABD1RGH3_9LAMI
MFLAEMLIDAGEVVESPGRIMVNRSLFWVYVNLLYELIFVSPLLKLPWKVVSFSMKLQTLVPSEAFDTNFTDEYVSGNKFVGKRANLSISICLPPPPNPPGE